MTQGEKDLLDNLYDYFFNKYDKEKALKYLNMQLDKLYVDGDISSISINDFNEIIKVKSDDTITEVTKKVKIIKLMRLFIERDALAVEKKNKQINQRPTYRSSC